jgi:hypothetical protein
MLNTGSTQPRRELAEFNPESIPDIEFFVATVRAFTTVQL